MKRGLCHRYGRSRIGDSFARQWRRARELNRRLFLKSVAVDGVPLAVFKKETWQDLDKERP